MFTLHRIKLDRPVNMLFATKAFMGDIASYDDSTKFGKSLP